MSKLNYLTTSELMEKASDIMIPLKNQLPAQQKIATIIAMHLARIQALNRGASPQEIISVSAFLAGATGSGKSYIIKSLADICGLHFRQIDCTSLTQAGVRGKNVAHFLDEINSNDPTFFEDGGILNLDEIDKTFYKNDPHYDAYSPQQDFLKLMEGGDYTYSVDNRTKTINLDRTLILLSGACSDIVKILKRKHGERVAIGFSSGGNQVAKIDDYASLITLDDLISYGMMAELASRTNTIIHIPKIDLNGYKLLLTASAKSSASNRFKNQFAMRGLQLDISTKAVDHIAAKCVARDVGARSVQAILNENLLDAYRTADETPECNYVRLYVNKDDQLRVKYANGERHPLPVFVLAPETKDFSLIAECSSEEEINRFADEMARRVQMDNIADERLVYYFLQTVCRFLGDDVRPSERTFLNLLKLADATERRTLDDDYKTTYDIICGDHIEKMRATAEHSEIAQVKATVFEHYYTAFREESSKRINSHRLLVDALKSAGNTYEPISERPMRRRSR